MKKYYSSFFSEHTAEYTLVPKITDILRQKYKVVIPIYPWFTRESSNFSKSLHQTDKFKAIGFYARRPKINIEEHKILVKINNEFKGGAKEALKFNIPMIAGSPLVRNLWELNNDPNCIWIKLSENTNDFYEIEYFDGLSPEYKIIQHNEVLNSEDELLDFTSIYSKEMDFENLLYAIQSIKLESTTVYFMGFGSYKPIYFLLRDELE